jgi:hypothetical protein
MAKKRARSRRRTSSRKRKGGGFRRRRGGGSRGLRGPLAKYGFTMPTMGTAWLVFAMLAGEVLVAGIEKILGKQLPDWIPESAAGLLAYGWYFKDAKAQEFAFALMIAEAVGDMEAVDGAIEKAKKTLGVASLGDEDDEDDEGDDAIGGDEGEALVGALIDAATESEAA